MYQSLDPQIASHPVHAPLLSGACDALPGKNWYAVYTHPRHEKACEKQLALRGIEVYLPTYSQDRTWKNRQRVKVQLPLFTSYLFVRIGVRDRSTVLQAPGVLRVLGNTHGPEPIPEAAIGLLRAEQFKFRIEPACGVDVGQKVRIRGGAFQGIEGVLMRKKNALWFVLSIDLINQRAMIEVQAHEIEAVPV